jgi:hypothetical protein
MLRRAVAALGPRVVNRRTALGKALATWKADLERDLALHHQPPATQLAPTVAEPEPVPPSASAP